MTRDDLVEYVLERLAVSSSRTDFVTQVVGHLNRAYVREVTDLGINMAESTIVFAANDPVIELPGDWRRTENIRVGSRILIEKTPEWLHNFEAAEAAGAAVGDGPTFYAHYPSSRHRVSPKPSADVTEGTHLYYAAPALMTTAGSTPDVLHSEYHDLLAEDAIAAMSANQEDPQQRNDALAAAALIREALRRQVKRGAGSSTNRIRLAHYG